MELRVYDSTKPIPTGAKFQVKLVESRSYNIDIGFTRLDPDSIDPVPKYFSECWKSKDYWVLSGCTAHHDGTGQDMSFSTHDLVPGDSVGVRVSENRDVHYYVNGRSKGRVFQHLPQHQELWGVVFLLCGAKIQSEFHFDLTTAEKMILLQEKVSRLEVAVQEKKGGATTQPGGVSRGDSEEMCLLRQQLNTHGQHLATQKQQLTTQEQQLTTQEQQLTTQEQQLAAQVQENEKLAFCVEGLSREQTSLQLQNQQLTTQLETQHKKLTAHFQQQLTDQLAEQRIIQKEI